MRAVRLVGDRLDRRRAAALVSGSVDRAEFDGRIVPQLLVGQLEGDGLDPSVRVVPLERAGAAVDGDQVADPGVAADLRGSELVQTAGGIVAVQDLEGGNVGSRLASSQVGRPVDRQRAGILSVGVEANGADDVEADRAVDEGVNVIRADQGPGSVEAGLDRAPRGVGDVDAVGEADDAGAEGGTAEVAAVTVVRREGQLAAPAHLHVHALTDQLEGHGEDLLLHSG
jgi:hypothetical protein